MLVEITGANKIYTTKTYKQAYSVLNSKVCVWHVEIYFKMLDFFKRREKSSRLLRKYTKIGKFGLVWFGFMAYQPL